MFPFIPSLLLVLLLAAPALLTPSASQELQVSGQRTPRDTKQDSIKVVISEGCATQGASSDVGQGDKELNLTPGSPLVLTHKIKLVPSGSGSGSCGCEADFGALRERLERLEREVSTLREKCGGPEGGCCTSKESKGAGCSITPEIDECPNECSDQGRCVDGKCVCFPGFSGPDCSGSNCPGNCNNNGRCVNGQCLCDPSFSGPDCSQRSCPDNCNHRGRCVNGRCVCDSGFTGPRCSDKSCPGNCNNRGRCVNGQCVCNPGFTGPDCSKKACPNNCNDRGRCVNGKCVCDSGFAGADCSENSCPENCNNRGRCVNGQCVCSPGFTGPDCSQRACPDDCNNRGRCANGKCVCDSGFAGADCSENSCPENCNNRGRCVNGQCVCSPGFTGPDCSQRACPDDCNNRGRCVNGKCVCDSGFAGADCSETACPGNCNSRGHCINGECVCDDGFSGPDCLEKTCPNDCSDRGRCVNGKCVCDSGFAGDDCSEKSCPGNCKSRGRCVNGQCVCNDGFTGADCSERACPNNCSNHGTCVNGKCACDVGFAGPDCAAKGCPSNCNNKGRCVKGRCVCRRGFTGPDCSQCEEGVTGPNCDTVMSGVSQLSTRDITEASVTLVWTPPPVQYETYHITFTSQKESDQQITAQVEGSLTTFTQTGLAAGQEYTVSITGEIDGRRGGESSAEFMTLISGPTNLQVVKTTSTSAVVQWEQSQGEIDRYRLTITPNDGAGRSQEMTIPAGQDSAHIRHLEAGRLYDIILVAEKATSQSEPATTKVTPGKTLPRVTMAALTMQVTLAPGQDVGDRDQEFNPSPKVQVFDQQGRREDEIEADSVKVGRIDGPNKASVIARTKPLVSRKLAINGTRTKLAERPTLSRKPNVPGPFRFNATRAVPGGRKVGPGPLKKPLVGDKKKAPMVPKKPKPSVPTIRDRTIVLTERDPRVEVSSTERRDDKNPAIMSGTDSDTNRQSSSKEPTVADGSKEQPDVGMAGHGNDTASVSSEPTETVQSQEKKCMNKIKVTHIRLPHKDRGSGCRGGGTVLVEKTPDSHQSSSETDDTPDLKPLSAETDLDYSPDPLHKLLTDTFDSLNITTFSVHLSKPSNLSVDSERVRKQILGGLKPLSSFPSWPSSSSTSQSSSQSSSSSSSSSSLAPPSIVSSSSTAAPSSSLTYLVSSSPSSLPSPSSSSPSPPSSLPSLSPSSPPSSSDKSGSDGSNEPDVDNSKSTTEDRKLLPSGKGGVPFFRRTPAKSGFIRPRPNFGSFQNKTHLNLRGPHHSPPRLNLIPGRETETRHTSTSELLSSPSSSASEESSSVEVNASVRDMSGNIDGATTTASSGVEQNQKKMPTERGRIPIRHFPLKGGYLRRPPPNFGPLQNRTRPNLRLLPPPSQPLNPASETKKKQVSSTELPATSSPPVSKESYPAEGTGPIQEENEVGTRMSSNSMSSEFNQTLRGSGVPSSHRPTTKVGYFRRPQLYGGRFQNKTRTNLRPSQHPHRGPMRNPTRKLNGGSSITVGSQISQLEKDRIPEIPDNQSGEQDTPMPTQGVQIRKSGEQDTAEVIPSAQLYGHDTTVRPQTNELDWGDSAPTQTTKSGEEETRAPDSNSDSDILKERVNAGKNTAATSHGRPTIKQTSSNSRPGAPRPVTLPKRQPPTRSTQIRHYISGSQRREDTKTNNTAKRLFGRKTEQTRSADSKPVTGSDLPSSGVTREPLGYVGVTNQTSDGFTLIWDSPEGKYKNFVVTRKEVGKDEGPKQKESKKGQEKQEDPDKEGRNEEEEAKHQPTKEIESENGSSEVENRVPDSVFTQIPRIQSSTTAKPIIGSDKTFKKVLPGSARSFQFENLPPQTEYTVTLLGKGPGLLSRLHKLVISTGPEPPTDIVFSEVTDNSLTVSWTKPKTPISGFKVTYTHTKDGEPVSVSVDSDDSTLELSKLSPGSSYEVSVISILQLDESDPIKDFVMTLPDPPTDLQAVNITDTKALLLWRPALAAIDKYAIVYGSGTGSELRVSVSGNAAEQQLSGLEGSTTYTVTITSQLGSLESSPATTTFTTAGGSEKEGDGPRNLQVRNVTPRTALLSWKPPSNPVGSYRLTYQTEGQEMKEVIVDASLTEYNLSRLHPGSEYTVQLQAEGGGRYTAAISADFTTGTLRFPFPTDCSQELLNGIRTSGEVEVFPQGKLGTPIMVYCDMETDGGGWTVFQRRKDGSVNFFRGWKEYSKGFGDLSGEFWLGLDSLHNLTAATRMSLRVDLRDRDQAVFAKYSTFEVAKRNYKLTVGGYSGTAGDSLSYHNHRIFSTKDRDLTSSITRCAMSYRGGWWYKNCHEANLNGLYGINVKHQGVIWTTWKGKEFSIPFTEMKMRPAAFSPPARG
ncbi:tenascin-like isoform X1 [Siniperca chuatsi]|uniref:tenascin-like isoform X1 n=1 Tax=Siniperca chuatsi TaxID=119488 RepID=UPI001CE0DEA6|nr:tenascin-like isoform X1 [Siniperca chuatsi]XP_044027879.1 tenascin-like isoform X1 [Siniperca chuatsi]XP_044027880.1 tenascin-like isoform X1 [Siniperca chuatsi]